MTEQLKEDAAARFLGALRGTTTAAAREALRDDPELAAMIDVMLDGKHEAVAGVGMVVGPRADREPNHGEASDADVIKLPQAEGDSQSPEPPKPKPDKAA